MKNWRRLVKALSGMFRFATRAVIIIGNFTGEMNAVFWFFSEVFKARCKRTGRIVALKKILMENEKEGVSFILTALLFALKSFLIFCIAPPLAAISLWIPGAAGRLQKHFISLQPHVLYNHEGTQATLETCDHQRLPAINRNNQTISREPGTGSAWKGFQRS